MHGRTQYWVIFWPMSSIIPSNLHWIDPVMTPLRSLNASSINLPPEIFYSVKGSNKFEISCPFFSFIIFEEPHCPSVL